MEPKSKQTRCGRIYWPGSKHLWLELALRLVSVPASFALLELALRLVDVPTLTCVILQFQRRE